MIYYRLNYLTNTEGKQMKILNLGIAGTGFAASDFVSKIDRKKYSIVAAFDIQPQALDNFTKLHQIEKQYTDFEDMIKNPKIECVYIGTPNQTHYPLMIQALQAGKHIICEKVMTLNSAQLAHVQSVAKEKQLVVIEGITLFYMPLFSKIKQMIESGMLGKISGLNVTFGSMKEFNATNRFFDRKKGGGALFDIGTYALSAVVYFLGTQTKLLNTEVVMSETGVDEKSVFSLINEEGILASAMISFRGKMPKQIIISGEKAYVTINDFPRAEEAVIFWNDGRVEKLKFGDERDVFNCEVETVNRYLESDSNEMDVREVTKCVIGIMDQAREQWGLTYPNEELV